MSNSKLRKIFFLSFFSCSILFNVIVIGGWLVWYQSRLRPFSEDARDMREVIKELSWNSGATWRLIEHDEKRIVVEYRVSIFQITRYSLSTEEFRLNDELKHVEMPFMLTYDECDIYSKAKGEESFKCMKFRDLSPRECKDRRVGFAL